MLRPCSTCGTLGLRKCPSCGTTIQGGPSTTAAAAALVLLGLVGCNDGDGMDTAVALYGMPAIDEDGDGFFDGEDCDDSDPAINPDAPETVGDGVDSNCDGDDDT